MNCRWSSLLAVSAALALSFAGARHSSAQSSPAGSASASASASAPAPPSPPAPSPVVTAVDAEILILHANNSGRGIDPKVRDLPQLKKPPFSSYNSYQVLGQSRVALPLGKQVDTPLPNNGTFRLSFKEALAPARFKLAATILQPDGKPFLPMLEVSLPYNEFFFVGAQSYTDNKQEGKLAVRLLKERLRLAIPGDPSMLRDGA
jgi:hypothetical protein